MAILAGVLLVHQPIYVLTQFLIARALQREVARVSIVVTLGNLALSFVLASVYGIWGVALSTLVTDVVAILWIVPRLAAPAAGSSTRQIAAAVLQPLAASTVAALVFLVALARLWNPRTLPELAALGILWAVAAVASIWRLGLSEAERGSIARQLRPGLRHTPLESGGI
jgi:O-antigen/teichoic acid export membrane protein